MIREEFDMPDMDEMAARYPNMILDKGERVPEGWLIWERAERKALDYDGSYGSSPVTRAVLWARADRALCTRIEPA